MTRPHRHTQNSIFLRSKESNHQLHATPSENGFLVWVESVIPNPQAAISVNKTKIKFEGRIHIGPGESFKLLKFLKENGMDKQYDALVEQINAKRAKGSSHERQVG